MLQDSIRDIYALIESADSENELLLALGRRIRSFQPFDRCVFFPDVARGESIDLASPDRAMERLDVTTLADKGEMWRVDTREGLGLFASFAGPKTTSLLLVACPPTPVASVNTSPRNEKPSARAAVLLGSKERWAFAATPTRRLAVLTETAARLRPLVSAERARDTSQLISEISRLSTERSALQAELQELKTRKRL